MRFLGKTDEQWERFVEKQPEPRPGFTVCVCHRRQFGWADVRLYKLNGSQRRRHRRR